MFFRQCKVAPRVYTCLELWHRTRKSCQRSSWHLSCEKDFAASDCFCLRDIMSKMQFHPNIKRHVHDCTSISIGVNKSQYADPTLVESHEHTPPIHASCQPGCITISFAISLMLFSVKPPSYLGNSCDINQFAEL